MKRKILIAIIIMACILCFADDDFIFVEGGTFQMGCNDYNSDNRPAHSVTVKSFYISKYEVTFEQYDKFCEDTGRENPDDKGFGRGNRPAINIRWADAIEYCNWLSEKQGLIPCYSGSGYYETKCDFSANGYRLPTEAEWEYAARGGNKSKGYMYSGSNNPDDVAWHYKNSGDKTYPVGLKNANELGIYDMTGNANEMCWGSRYKYPSSAEIDPKGGSSWDRASRGGDYYSPSVRSVWSRTFNGVVDRDFGDSATGFRLVRSAG